MADVKVKGTGTGSDELSRGINWYLKHGTLLSDGFIDVDTILKHRNLKKKYSREDIQTLIGNQAEHKRFVLRYDSSKMYIASEKHLAAMMAKTSEELSRELSRYLRHGNLRPDGFAEVDIMLKHQDLKKYSREDVKTLVANQAEFKRFTLRYAGKRMYIASQINEIIDKPHWVQILNESSVPSVIYPTTFENLKIYSSNGFCRKNKRGFMRFFLEDESKVYYTYGLRPEGECPPDIDVIIYINLKLALEDGLEFFRSEQNLILTRGNAKGILEPKYIEKVADLRAAKFLPFPLELDSLNTSNRDSKDDWVD